MVEWPNFQNKFVVESDLGIVVKEYIAYFTKISIDNFLQFLKLDFFNLTYPYNIPYNFRMEFSVLVHCGFPIMWLKSLDSCDTSGFVDLP